jgi:hypothetical protein
MAEYEGISQFVKAAERRLRDAEELLQPPTLAPQEQGAETRHLRAAVYLAGYAIECILKVYIIQQQGVKTLTAAVDALRKAGKNVPDLNSTIGHHLQRLLSLTDLERQLDNERERKKDWNICLKWRSNWRYDPTSPTRANAEEFVKAVRSVYAWVKALC